MFSPEYLEGKLELTETYRRIAWDAPPSMPMAIEFLDGQHVLVSGILYLSPEGYATEFFKQTAIKAYPGAVLFISDASDRLPYIPDEAGCMTVFGFTQTAGRIYNQLISYLEAPRERDSSARFGELWAEIMTSDTITMPEIREKFNKIPEIVEPFVQVAVAVFYDAENKSIPYTRIMHQLKALIPNSCATVRDKEIVIVISYGERRFDYPFDFGQISSVLEKYNGYMGISNGTRQLQSVKALYKLTRRIITLAHEMGISAPDRIFSFDRLGTYSAHRPVRARLF